MNQNQKIDKELALSILNKHPRSSDDHKGTNGHALLISGSFGMMGSAILASRAATRSGLGKLTTLIPDCGYEVFQIAIPEALCIVDTEKDHISQIPVLDEYDAIGMGPGIGRNAQTKDALNELLKRNKSKTILDADALNLLSENRDLLNLLNDSYILTPHPKEFARLIGTNILPREELIQKQIEMSKSFNVTVILKGSQTTISLPDGRLFENTTGGPGLATAGTGDVLTGILVSLLAQGFTVEETALFGVYLHGLAGDLCEKEIGIRGMVSTDIVNFIPKAYIFLEKL
jgi:NAD(P)H-hydrate epimerase